MGKQGCSGGGNIPGSITYRASPLGPERENSETVPREFKQVKHYGEGTAGDLRGQILREDVFPGLSAGESCCFWEAWCPLTEVLGVFLFRHPLGRLGFSSGALGTLMWNAPKLPPSLTTLLASLKINK